MNYCKQCGAKLNNGAKFCRSCGASQIEVYTKEDTKEPDNTGKNTGDNTGNSGNRAVLVVLGIVAVLLVILILILVNRDGRPWDNTEPSTEPPAYTPGGEAPVDTNPTAAPSGQNAHVHEWGEWSIETPVGCETPGVEVRFCIYDPSHQERRAISATGHDWVEATTTSPKMCRNCGLTEGERLKTSYEILVEKCKAYDSKIELPLESEMLSQTVTRYVRGKNKNGGIYLCRMAGGTDPIPNTTNPLVLRNYTPLTLYAVRGSWTDGHALIETPTGQMGWVRLDRLSETNDFSY